MRKGRLSGGLIPSEKVELEGVCVRSRILVPLHTAFLLLVPKLQGEFLLERDSRHDVDCFVPANVGPLTEQKRVGPRAPETLPVHHPFGDYLPLRGQLNYLGMEIDIRTGHWCQPMCSVSVVPVHDPEHEAFSRPP